MSRENVEIVRRVVALFRNRDTDTEVGFGEADVAEAIGFFDSDFELDATRSPMTDIRGTFHGFAEALGFWARWLEAWETIEFEEQLTDAGDRVLVSIERQVMRGKGSGVEIEFPPYWMVFTMRAGLIVRQSMYLDELEAQKAAGLAE